MVSKQRSLFTIFCSSLLLLPLTRSDDAETCSLVPLGCRTVLAPSSVPNSGWGVFVLEEHKKGVPLILPDLVVHISDLERSSAAATDLGRLVRDYWWSAEETGGYYEGQSVVAHVPGVGMLANGGNKGNVLPFVPTVHEGGITRQNSPGAGAFTHYHNYSFYAQQTLEPGTEVWINYGSNWVNERLEAGENLQEMPPSERRSVEWLRENGHCLDHLMPIKTNSKATESSTSSSPIAHAGRGVMARRLLPSGTPVLTVPVLPLTRASLEVKENRDDSNIPDTPSQQLLLNYCFGHVNSTWLLLPYGPAMSLVNHAATTTSAEHQKSLAANVRVQWATNDAVADNVDDVSLEDFSAASRSTEKPLPKLLLQLVATRDISPGEEILLDYGSAWTQAWQKHIETWQPPPLSNRYAPSYVYQDAIQALRVQAELKTHPYPPNIFTSCFFKYDPVVHKAAADAGDGSITTIPWKMERGLFALEHLRPCQVLSRKQQQPGQQKSPTLFTVQIRNRYGIARRIPAGQHVVVTHVPRHAIRFSDKIYTTDQHLPEAFRHPLTPDGVFPKHWLDLENQ